jgi:PTH1 family peptidyl-tRNA hydrolase
MIQLVAFLGNYGREYASTRHNAAWIFESSLPFAAKIPYQSKFKAEFASMDSAEFFSWLKESNLLAENFQIPHEQKKIFFSKPQTYMNLSGEAIFQAAKFYKIPAEEILIVHDEIELPLGTLSLKFGGGLGGHNGLRSAKENLGTADFFRLRFGVGKPADKNVADYVLGEFSADERIALSQVFSTAQILFAKILCSRDAKNLIGEWGKKKVIPEAKK